MMRALPLLATLAVSSFGTTAAAQWVTPPSGPSPSTEQPPLSSSTPDPIARSEADPLEAFNRKVFWFNDQLDVYVLVPVAKGWDFVVPRRAQTSVSNFFANLRFPIDTMNNLFQGKVRYAAVDVGRFAINTTAGVAGFFDPATSLGLEPHVEDFGQTLGWWGVGPGPYLMLPILGPSTVRDGVGILADYPLAVTPFFVDWYYLFGARTVEIVNFRASILDTVEKAKEASFDYYSFVRNAYLQRRTSAISDQASPSQETQDDLYHPEKD